MSVLKAHQIPVWKEAITVNKQGSPKQKLEAYANLCRMYGDAVLDKAIDIGGRMYDPSSAGFNEAGSWFAAALELDKRAAAL